MLGPSPTPAPTLTSTPALMPNKSQDSYLYQYKDDNRAIPLSTVPAPLKEDLDKKELCKLQRLNLYVKTSKYIDIRRLLNCVKNS